MKKTILILIFAILLSSFVYAQNIPIGLQKLIEHRMSLANSVTFFIAFFAGLISFTSPCGIAFLPAFFSVAFKERKKTMLTAAVFSMGMIAAFTLFGLMAGLLGDFFNSYKLMFAVVSGFILVIFAILIFLNVNFWIFNFKVDFAKKTSFVGSGLTGFFFGIGFTPCAGPILLGILFLASNASTLLNGVLLLIFYGLGIATPLFVLSYFSDKYDFYNSRLLRGKLIEFSIFGKKITTHTYNLIASVLLLIIGMLMIIYQGTFFFQTDLPRYFPWSMSFWALMNEKILESTILTSHLGNAFGVLVALTLIYLVFRNIKSEQK